MITLATGDKAKIIRNFLKEYSKSDKLKEIMSHFTSAAATVGELFDQAIVKDEDVDAVR